ncbi:MAG: hypothetical protein QM758_02700 [Armatimonas sp.]
MARRWLAMASALMLAWTFFLGAALTVRCAPSATSSHVCACVMCKGGTKKSCCCSGETSHTLRAACDTTDAENLLLVSIPANLPPVLLAPLPLLDTSRPEAVITPTAPAPTRAPLPPYIPPRSLS